MLKIISILIYKLFIFTWRETLKLQSKIHRWQRLREKQWCTSQRGRWKLDTCTNNSPFFQIWKHKFNWKFNWKFEISISTSVQSFPVSKLCQNSNWFEFCFWQKNLAREEIALINQVCWFSQYQYFLVLRLLVLIKKI